MTKDHLKTSDHTPPGFAPHGEVTVWAEDQIFYYDVTGPFNIETMRGFGPTVAALLARWQPKGPYVSYTTWHESMMATPEALSLYARVLKSGRTFLPPEIMNVWFVPKDIEGLLIMRKRWEAIYSDGGYPLEIVHSDAEGRERVQWHLQHPE